MTMIILAYFRRISAYQHSYSRGLDKKAWFKPVIDTVPIHSLNVVAPELPPVALGDPENKVCRSLSISLGKSLNS